MLRYEKRNINLLKTVVLKKLILKNQVIQYYWVIMSFAIMIFGGKKLQSP